VDLHTRVSQIAVLSANGELTQHRLENDRARVHRFFAQVPAPARVAIEASGTWWWLVDLLEQLGHQPVLSHPKQTRAIAAARLKTDRVDAERLVQLLRGDLLPTVWIPPTAVREAREPRPVFVMGQPPSLPWEVEQSS
jgi:transposase